MGNKTQEAVPYKGWLLLNHKSGTAHKASRGGQTPCNFVRNAAAAHFVSSWSRQEATGMLTCASSTTQDVHGAGKTDRNCRSEMVRKIPARLLLLRHRPQDRAQALKAVSEEHRNSTRDAVIQQNKTNHRKIESTRISGKQPPGSAIRASDNKGQCKAQPMQVAHPRQQHAKSKTKYLFCLSFRAGV